MIVDPKSGNIVSQSLKAGVSQVGFSSPLFGARGTATMSGASAPGGDGKTTFTMSFSGKNGLAAIAPWLGTERTVALAKTATIEQRHTITEDLRSSPIVLKVFVSDRLDVMTS